MGKHKKSKKTSKKKRKKKKKYVSTSSASDSESTHRRKKRSKKRKSEKKRNKSERRGKRKHGDSSSGSNSDSASPHRTKKASQKQAPPMTKQAMLEAQFGISAPAEANAKRKSRSPESTTASGPPSKPRKPPTSPSITPAPPTEPPTGPTGPPTVGPAMGPSGSVVPKKRAAGPVMPSAELLQHYAVEEEEQGMGPKRPDAMTEKEKLELQALQRLREVANWEKGIEAQKAQRETWMTELPDEFNLNAAAKDDQKARQFSMKGVNKRGDTSAWTDTPAERERKKLEAAIKARSMLEVDAVDEASDRRARAKARALAVSNGTEELREDAELVQEETQDERLRREFLELKRQKKMQKQERKERKQALEEFQAQGFEWDREAVMKEGRSKDDRMNTKFKKGEQLMKRFDVGGTYGTTE